MNQIIQTERNIFSQQKSRSIIHSQNKGKISLTKVQNPPQNIKNIKYQPVSQNNSPQNSKIIIRSISNNELRQGELEKQLSHRILKIKNMQPLIHQKDKKLIEFLIYQKAMKGVDFNQIQSLIDNYTDWNKSLQKCKLQQMKQKSEIRNMLNNDNLKEQCNQIMKYPLSIQETDLGFEQKSQQIIQRKRFTRIDFFKI